MLIDLQKGSYIYNFHAVVPPPFRKCSYSGDIKSRRHIQSDSNLLCSCNKMHPQCLYYDGLDYERKQSTK